MKSYKEHRFKNNPKEKDFHDKFKRMFNSTEKAKHSLNEAVFGWQSSLSYLSEDERDICLNLIQWLGSPVGQEFLEECGFVPKTYSF